MKKLMTMIGAAVAAFGLYADDPVDLFEENEVDFTADELGPYDFHADPTFGTQYWYFDGEVEGTVKEADSVKYLELDASAPVYRAAAAVDVSPEQVAIAGAERGGIVFDQKVKFSAFDEAPTDLGDAKIAVWVKAVEADNETAGSTNLMITCGKLGIMLTPDSEESAVTINAGPIDDLDKFYQLKITAIEAAINTGNSKVVPGFKVELDGTPVTYVEELFPTDIGDSGCAYTPEGAALITAKELFPSLVEYTTTNGSTLQGVGFKGTGAIESIDITAYTAPVTTYNITITAPENGTLETSVTNGVAAGTEVTVTATPNGGYELVSITTNGQVLAGSTFVMPAENVTVAATFQEKAQDWPKADDPNIIGKPASDIFGDKIPEDLRNVPASRFTKWASDPAKGNLDFATCTAGAVNIDAYLLDCAPGEVATEKAKINIASIEFVNDEWVVTTVSNGEAGDEFGNGKLQLLDVTESITGVEGSDAAMLWKMKLVPNTTPDNN